MPVIASIGKTRSARYGQADTFALLLELGAEKQRNDKNGISPWLAAIATTQNRFTPVSHAYIF